MLIAFAMIALSASLMAIGELPPSNPLPAELEVCILKADLCVEEASFCGTVDPPAGGQGWQSCISEYEDCAYGFPEAGEPSCRVVYVWCRLEESPESPEWMHEMCKEAYSTCPS